MRPISSSIDQYILQFATPLPCIARRAQLRDEELLVVVGDCNAQTGIGDPYLPFREVLGMPADVVIEVGELHASGTTSEIQKARFADA